MRWPAHLMASLLLAFGLIQLFQMGMVTGLKMANAANGIDLAVGPRLLLHAGLCIACTAAAAGLWARARKTA